MRYRLKAYVGRQYWTWRFADETGVNDKWKDLSTRGIIMVSPTGIKTIIPPWRITKFIVAPIREKARATIVRATPATGVQ